MLKNKEYFSLKRKPRPIKIDRYFNQGLLIIIIYVILFYYSVTNLV